MRAESRPEYEALIVEYYERFHPTVPEERCLVDMLIKSEWHSRRYMSIDAGIWERGFLDTSTDELSLGRVFERSDKVFDRVGRRINSAQRNFQNALKQLMDIRAKRAKEPYLEIDVAPHPEPLEPAQILPSRDREGAALETSGIATKPLNHKLVSFLQNESEPETPPSAPTANHPKTEDDPPIAA